MARLKLHDARIAYRLEGKEGAPALVFSHALAASADMWRYQIAEFSRDRRILAYDMRGHGDSDAPDYPYDFDLLADDAASLMRGLGIERAVFVGISIGGMIGQALALRHPELLSGLALASTTAQTPPEGRKLWEQRLDQVRRQGLEPQVSPTLERWFSSDFRQSHPEIVGWVADMIRSTPVAGYVGCGHAIMTLDLISKLPRIGVPTLVIAGEKDLGAPPSAARAIAEAIPGAEMEILADCLHQTAIEAPGRFNRRLRAFLESLPS
jgi:3-oxoadipate enol-lactonase